MIQSPNIKKLIAHKMSLLMIPPGCENPLGTGLKALTNSRKLAACAREATTWVAEAIAVVKTAPDNPYADDEAIAGAILKGIEDRKKK